jgi:putative membrane protein
MVTIEQRESPYKKLIIGLSIIIPVLVAVLFRVQIDGYDLSFLPPIYATINGITAFVLITAAWAIKNNRRLLHELLMKLCIGLSGAFLVMYVLYHMTSSPTPYGGGGPIKYVYYFILITHIVLSIFITPLVLFTFSRALEGSFVNHKKLAKFTFPIWLYIAVTGVIVYLMISPYYK